MYFKEDVARLVSELGNVKFDPAVELGKADDFGLSLDLFDPVSGQIIALARPARIDLGHQQILLTAAQARTAVAAARTGHLHRVRGMGFASIEEFNEAHKRDVAAADLKAKQAAETAKMNQQHADAINAAAADGAPNRGISLEAANAADQRAVEAKRKAADARARSQSSPNDQQLAAEATRLEADALSQEQAAAAERQKAGNQKRQSALA